MKENGDLLWKRTFSEIYFLGKRGFYWNPETGQILLDPEKKVPQSMQLPSVPVRIGECLNSGMWLSGNIRTRENCVSQIGMKPGSHITGNARRRECNEKCKDDWILVKTLTNQLICVQFPFVARYCMGIRVPLPCNMCYFLGVASQYNRFYIPKGKRSFYWNPETGQISLDPGVQLPRQIMT